MGVGMKGQVDKIIILLATAWNVKICTEKSPFLVILPILRVRKGDFYVQI